MSALVRAHAWSGTPIGPVERWPQSLRTSVEMVLASGYPATVLWGPDLVQIYNDGYREILAGKHPAGLGQATRECWPEAWHINEPIYQRVWKGETVTLRDSLLPATRRGNREDAWFDCCYSPLRDEEGTVAGILVTLFETTARHLAELERDRVRAAHDAGETRLRHALNLGRMMAWEWDLATGVVHRSDMTSEAFRFGLESGSLDDSLALLREEDRRRVKQALHAALRGEADYEVEFRLTVPSGRELWVVDRGRVERDPDGRPVRMTGILTDITAHKAVERALALGEERYRSLVEATAAIVWSTPASGRFEAEQPGWSAFTGQSFEDLKGWGWLNAVHPDDRANTISVWSHAVNSRSIYQVEHRLRRWDGTHRHMMVRAVPILDASGQVREWVGVHTDVHEQREMEARLRESEARFRVLADTVPAFVWFATPDVELQYLNDRWYEYTGQTPEEALPNGWMAVLHPEDVERTAAAWADARVMGVTYEMEARFRRHDGEYRWYVSRAEPLRDEAGLITAWFGTSTDIHDRKLAEAELQRMTETLEQRVADEVAERGRAEEALRQAQKMEAIGQLTGGVAHDFNNLLTIIRSSADLLRRPNLTEERRRRYVDAIADTVERAAKLTGQLLAFARRQALKPEIFDAGVRVRTTVDMLRSLVGSRIRIMTDIPGKSCLVEADASQFETALVNMAVNARDAMDGEGTLTVRVGCMSRKPATGEDSAGPGTFVAVSLSDTGCGIAAEDLVKIFEPFFTTKEVGKGTGLGLSQVYGFAKQSGGDIVVESEEGRGTTFTLYLPKVEREVVTDDASGRPAGVEPASDGRGRRVLVVEDNLDVGASSTQVLQDLGYETTLAANAGEALARLAEGVRIDVVFSDVVMPGMSGVELGREIRRLYPGLPVVLTSGYSHVLAEEGRHGFELLQKPYAAEELSRVLYRVTQGPDTR
ncbi:MAG TPA: PAS domain-containing protein [Azospirillaceae bacterium]|nr:PAS domain-containing protein [Azospirillaceae bacterium]